MPDIHDLWALGSCYQLGREKWDWVVSTGWPYSVHFVGYLTKIRKLTKGWLVDWRDPWIIDNPVFPGIPVFRTIEKIFEKRFHSHADRITTVSEPWAESLATVYNRQVNVIYNGFDPDDYKQLDNSRFFPIDDKIRIIHTGSIYSGHRNPAILFSAIKAIELSEGAEAQRIEIDFAGPRGFPSEMIKQYGVEKYCVDKGFLPRELALKMQKEASFLLYLDWSDTGNKGVIGGKTFEYLFAGPPILVVGGNTRSIASKLIIDTNKGIAFGNNVEMLADFLRNALKRNCQNLLFEGTDTIWQYSRENQARQMLGLLEK